MGSEARARVGLSVPPRSIPVRLQSGLRRWRLPGSCDPRDARRHRDRRCGVAGWDSARCRRLRYLRPGSLPTSHWCSRQGTPSGGCPRRVRSQGIWRAVERAIDASRVDFAPVPVRTGYAIMIVAAMWTAATIGELATFRWRRPLVASILPFAIFSVSLVVGTGEGSSFYVVMFLAALLTYWGLESSHRLRSWGRWVGAWSHQTRVRTEVAHGRTRSTDRRVVHRTGLHLSSLPSRAWATASCRGAAASARVPGTGTAKPEASSIHGCPSNRRWSTRPTRSCSRSGRRSGVLAHRVPRGVQRRELGGAHDDETGIGGRRHRRDHRRHHEELSARPDHHDRRARGDIAPGRTGSHERRPDRRRGTGSLRYRIRPGQRRHPFGRGARGGRRVRGDIEHPRSRLRRAAATPSPPSSRSSPSSRRPSPPRSSALRDGWVGEAESPYEQLVALQEGLRLDPQFDYDLEPPEPEDDDYLHDFLVRSKTGFCQQYASAFALLARSLGYPARVSVGFLPGEQSAGREHIHRARDRRARVARGLFRAVRLDRVRADPSARGGNARVHESERRRPTRRDRHQQPVLVATGPVQRSRRPR